MENHVAGLQALAVPRWASSEFVKQTVLLGEARAIDFGQDVFGPLRSMERVLERCWRDVVEVAVRPAGVVPMDPTKVASD